MLKHHHLDLDEFLRLAVEQVEKMLDALPEAISNEPDKLRLREGVRLYALLKEKYSFDTVDIISMLNRYPVFILMKLPNCLLLSEATTTKNRCA